MKPKVTTMDYNDKYPDMSAMYAVQFEYENKLKDKIKELETKLERTRKALNIAVDAMKKSNEIVYSAYGSPLKTLKDALEQIESITKAKE